MSRRYLVPILLPGDPTAALEAAPKQYVDAAAAGAADEVWIGPDAPAGSTLELWYDTDAANMNDPETGRWNSSWGVIGIGSFPFGDNTALTPGGSMTNPLNVTTVVGRLYRVVFLIRAWAAAANQGNNVAINIDGANGAERWCQVIGSNGYTQFATEWLHAGTGGPHAFKVVWGGAGGAAGYPENGEFYVEDIGPATQATNPPTQPASAWTNLTLASGWTPRAGAVPQYRMVGDVVQLRGRALGAAGTITTLPVGFRPVSDTLTVIGVITGGVWATGVLYVDPPTGQVTMQTTGQSEVALNQVMFSVTL
jgi:hypothetical protein